MQIKSTLRYAKQKDFDFVFELNKANFKDFVDEIRGWNDKIEYEDLKHAFHPNEDFIITYEEQDIGFLSLQYNPENIHVNHIEILPQYKYRGIGTNIFNHLKEKGLPIILEVKKNNTPACPFYKKLGFTVMNEMKVLKNGIRGPISLTKITMKLDVQYDVIMQ